MRMFKILIVTAAVAAPLATLPGEVLAATASNSQAGAWGHNKNSCKATPYFPEGGCLSSFFTGQDDGQVFSDTERYRERRPLRPLDR